MKLAQFIQCISKGHTETCPPSSRLLTSEKAHKFNRNHCKCVPFLFVRSALENLQDKCLNTKQLPTPLHYPLVLGLYSPQHIALRHTNATLSPLAISSISNCGRMVFRTQLHLSYAHYFFEIDYSLPTTP